MSSDSLSETTAGRRYTIRAYEPADLDGFLQLDRQVWDRTRSPEWFRWKYVDNPYADRTPVFVAEHDGEIVGVRPFLALRLQIGDHSVSAYQPADTMVHPDHRREGLFRRMTTHALSALQDRDPALFFNFPNQYARPGYLKLGWRTVTPRVTYYRVETPNALPTNRLSAALQPMLRGYYAARESLSTPPEGLIVRQVAGAATSRLAALHRQCRHPKIHAERTETFLDWRLSSPVWERRTYFVAERETPEEPIAALVARSRTTKGGMRLTQVVDVAPLSGGERWRKAVWEGLRGVIATHETDLFAVSNGAIPHEILAAVGFLPDSSPLVSRFTSFETMLVARPNTDPDDESAWRIAGRTVDDPDNWCVTFAERDTT